MKRIVEMPEVNKCEVTTCAYNVGKMCHARAITVGDISDHLCDTMCSLRKHTHCPDMAGVGACKAIECIHNEELECQADGIRVGVQDGQAQCLTFAKR